MGPPQAAGLGALEYRSLRFERVALRGVDGVAQVRAASRAIRGVRRRRAPPRFRGGRARVLSSRARGKPPCNCAAGGGA